MTKILRQNYFKMCSCPFSYEREFVKDHIKWCIIYSHIKILESWLFTFIFLYQYQYLRSVPIMLIYIYTCAYVCLCPGSAGRSCVWVWLSETQRTYSRVRVFLVCSWRSDTRTRVLGRMFCHAGKLSAKSCKKIWGFLFQPPFFSLPLFSDPDKGPNKRPLLWSMQGCGIPSPWSCADRINRVIGKRMLNLLTKKKWTGIVLQDSSEGRYTPFYTERYAILNSVALIQLKIGISQ